MQYVKCQVYLGGDRNHSVTMPNVSVAEVVVLRALHGDDSVYGIQRTKMHKTPIKEELERLRMKYDPSGITEGGIRIVERLFPGSNPKAVPVNLSDIGDFADEDEEADRRAQAEADESFARATASNVTDLTSVQVESASGAKNKTAKRRTATAATAPEPQKADATRAHEYDDAPAPGDHSYDDAPQPGDHSDDDDKGLDAPNPKADTGDKGNKDSRVAKTAAKDGKKGDNDLME